MTQLPISVLLPFRNAAPYLRESLDSIAAQSFQDYQVIMVNDSTTDSSQRTAAAYAERDSRFSLVDNSGRGLVDALNTGLHSAEGTWIARMDADDLAHEDRLKEQLKLAEQCGTETVVTCMVRSFPREEVTEGFRRYEEWLNGLVTPKDIRHNIFVESPVPHPSAFFHRESILARGGYMERELPEDYELWLRLWSMGFSFARVPRILLFWREHRNRFSRVSPAYSLTGFYRLKARYLEHVPCMSRKRIIIAGSGQTGRRLGKCLQDSGFTIEAFVDPSTERQGSTLRGAPIIPPEWLVEKRDLPVVVASRMPGARDAVKSFLKGLGYREWEDFVCCS